VVASIHVGHNGGDPDGVEAQTLDVVEVIRDALPSTTAVVTKVVTVGGVAVGAGKSVSQHLIDGAGLPGFFVTSQHSCSEESTENRLAKSLFHLEIKYPLFKISIIIIRDGGMRLINPLKATNI
jgi:hypothetical protein